MSVLVAIGAHRVEQETASQSAAVAANVRFAEMTALAEAFEFSLARVSGSHHIYKHARVTGLVNLQEVGGKAKPYQVRQFLRLVERYNLQLKD